MNILRPIQKDYYGDDYRWFFGTVINHTPPAGLEGRVKVRIIGVHNADTGEIPEADLPWAQVLIPTTEGGSSGIGGIPQLKTGAFVFGVFLDGQTSQLPLIMGAVPRTELPSTVQSGRRSSLIDTFNYAQDRIQNVVITPIRDDSEAEATVGLRRQQSMKFFIDNGYKIFHAAAITGALEEKSQFKTYTDTEADATFGIAGWTQDATVGSRYVGLLRFGGTFSPPRDYQLFSTQLQFVLFELRTAFNLANAKILATENIEDASDAVNRYYLGKVANTRATARRAYEEVFV